MLFETPELWAQWLRENYLSGDGLWIKFAKAASGIRSMSSAEALEEALCWGWIDGQRKPFDEAHYLNKYTPRRKRSLWSKRNCGIADRLIAEGRMQPQGMKEIEAAKADGRWEQAYDAASTMQMPADFLERLAQYPEAFAFFNTLNKTNRYAICWRLQTARKPETRERRMVTLLEMLQQGKKFH